MRGTHIRWEFSPRSRQFKPVRAQGLGAQGQRGGWALTCQMALPQPHSCSHQVPGQVDGRLHGLQGLNVTPGPTGGRGGAGDLNSGGWEGAAAGLDGKPVASCVRPGDLGAASLCLSPPWLPVVPGPGQPPLGSSALPCQAPIQHPPTLALPPGFQRSAPSPGSIESPSCLLGGPLSLLSPLICWDASGNPVTSAECP